MKRTFTLLSVLLSACLSFAQPISISVTPVTSTAIPVYSKFEAGMSLSLQSINNPFDLDEINVYVKFTHVATGYTRQVDAFWYQDYSRYENTPDPTYAGVCATNVIGVADPAYLTPKTTPLPWRVRFSPDRVGEWQYQVFVKHVSSATIYASLVGGFTALESSSEGYIKVASNNHNFMYSLSKRPFIPMGVNVLEKASIVYNRAKFKFTRDVMEKLAANKGNTLRVFMTPDSYGLEWEEDGIGRYATRQNCAFDLDEIFSLAETLGIKIQLVLESSHTFNINPDGAQAGLIFWDHNPYRQFLGSAPRYKFFSNANCNKYFGRRMRYIIARWGYSTALLSYEFFNEVERVDLVSGQSYWDQNYASDVIIWHAAMANVFRALDPNHMVTTSVGIYSAGDVNAPNSLSTMPQLDYFQDHWYTNDMNMPYQLKAFADKRTKVSGRPYLCGEFGPQYSICWTGAASFTDYDPNTSPFPAGQHAHWNNELHNSMWSGLFNGSAGPALYWNSWDIANNCWGGAYAAYKPMAAFLEYDDFFSNPLLYLTNKPSGGPGAADDTGHYWGNNAIPYQGVYNDFDGYLSYGVNTSDDASLDVFAAQSLVDSRIYGWVHNRNNYWFNLPHFSGGNLESHCKDPRPISTANVPTLTKQTMTFNNVGCDGMYRVDFYTTYPQYDINGDAVPDDGGQIQPFTQYWVGASCGHLTVTLPNMPPLTPGGNAWEPDYAFKISRMQDYWTHSWVTPGLSQTSSVSSYQSDKVYYNDANGAIWRASLNTTTNTTQTELISPALPPSNEKAMYNIYVNENQQVYYKGFDGKLQCYYYGNGAWNHVWLTDFNNNPQDVSYEICSGPFNIFFQGLDANLHRFYFDTTGPGWTHSILNTDNDPNKRVLGAIGVDRTTNNVFYAGYDHRLQCFYRDLSNNGNYVHIWLTNWNNTSENVGGDIKVNSTEIYYVGMDEYLHKYYFNNNTWTHYLVVDGANQPIHVPATSRLALTENAEQIFFIDENHQMSHLYQKQGNNKYFRDNVICPADQGADLRGNGMAICDNQDVVYYVGYDNQLHLYAFDNGCTPRPVKRVINDAFSGDIPPAGQQVFEKNTLIYPNPFSNEMKIKTGSRHYDEIRILNMMGQTVHVQKTTGAGPEVTVNTAAFPPGVYMVLVLDQGKKVFEGKAVKM